MARKLEGSDGDDSDSDNNIDSDNESNDDEDLELDIDRQNDIRQAREETKRLISEVVVDLNSEKLLDILRKERRKNGTETEVHQAGSLYQKDAGTKDEGRYLQGCF